ncbi:hypothetical protein AWI95_14710 [Listeria monocytogenes]|nr:hypothetical protein AWI95_14710 [Listeria monocytogenes]
MCKRNMYGVIVRARRQPGSAVSEVSEGSVVYKRQLVYVAFQYDLHDARIRDVDKGRLISDLDKFWSGECF